MKKLDEILKQIDVRKLVRIGLMLTVLLCVVGVCTDAFADVGNQNRYSSGGSSSSSSSDDDGLAGFIVGLLISLLFEHPVIGIPLVIIGLVWWFIAKRRKNGSAGLGLGRSKDGEDEPQQYGTWKSSQEITAQIQAIDPMFSAEKFTSWVREVFLKLQQAWTERNWKTIRPFESEELFATHNAQLEEYIRNNKINVVEKIGIKTCELVGFSEDGDKEVLTVRLSAVMRDYVIDATTRKVLESDPKKDWYMNYQMVFARKKGVKTQEGLSNKSTTNCPNCGAPTEITSAGQCEYCGSVITTGEHDWVLTDIHSI